MEQTEILFRILLTVIFGSILGLETETREVKEKGQRKAKADEKSRIGGLRTYTILSLIGGLSGILFNTGEFILVYITFIGLICLVVSAYIQNIRIKQAFGLTTEIAIFITFLIGFLTTSNLVNIEVNLVILVLLTFFLSQKRGVGKIISSIQHEELIDITKFGLISIVALPLLPNQDFHIVDFLRFINFQNFNSVNKDILEITLINPFRTWLIVVIISGIDLAGYILSKIIGSRKGIFITSILGGIISSTSTTVAFAQESKKSNGKLASLFAGAATISNSVSLISISFLLLVINFELFKSVALPLATMIIIGFSTGVIMILKQKHQRNTSTELNLKHKPFSLKPAVRFVILIVLIKLLIQFLNLIGNDYLVVALTAISGILGLDTPTVAISDLQVSGNISLSLASIIFLVTNSINFFAKIMYGYLSGGKKFSFKLLVSLMITLAGTFAVLIPKFL